jgi:hydroxymethylglutaryl-CoA lyase
MNKLKLTECPRDAMQGLTEFIPTEKKIAYINALLSCGFDTIDFGSFVSPKAIPQMRDTAEVINKLDLKSNTKLLAIVANERGATEASTFEEINYLGFPFSVSEEFQKRNTNSTIEESLSLVDNIQNTSVKHNKKLVIYISMGFGNPYGEEWNTDIVQKWVDKLHHSIGVEIIALSDTIGSASIGDVSLLFDSLIDSYTAVSFGAHFHARPEKVYQLIEAAYNSGCRRFDSAIKGFGGCPMAKDDLTGNVPTELMLAWFNQQGIETNIQMYYFNYATKIATEIFPIH